MTRTTNSRIAGFTFLAYIVFGLSSMGLSARAAHGATIAEKLASLAQHLFEAHLTILLGLLETACAIVLAVTLYSLTRDEDADVALMAMICRVGEGLVGAFSIYTATEKLWLATAGTAAASSAPLVAALGPYLFNVRHGGIDAILFVMGSTLFAWLFLRGRIIPRSLAWLGLVASALLLLVLPLEFAGFLSGSFISFLWLPMLVYEVWLGLWLIVKGARPSRAVQLHNSRQA